MIAVGAVLGGIGRMMGQAADDDHPILERREGRQDG
jgi:hypothetical protein